MDKSVYQFISQQTNDPIIERRTCTVSREEFPIYQSDKEFYDKISPTFVGEKFLIPFPTLSPKERQRRRATRRNERSLYKSTCAFSHKPIISMYHPESPYTIYDQDVRRSDKRNPLDYGRDFDFSRPFLEQFHEMQLQVPRINLFGKGNENSMYTNHTDHAKNSYMSIDTARSEYIFYSKRVIDSRKCGDSYYCIASELCYEVSYSVKCYKCIYGMVIDNCIESFFL